MCYYSAVNSQFIVCGTKLGDEAHFGVSRDLIRLICRELGKQNVVIAATKRREKKKARMAAI